MFVFSMSLHIIIYKNTKTKKNFILFYSIATKLYNYFSYILNYGKKIELSSMDNFVSECDVNYYNNFRFYRKCL